MSAIALLAVSILSWVEFRSGPEISFEILFLIPIALAGWFGGREPALLTAVAAAAMWFAGELRWIEAGIGVRLWNSLTRLVVYTTEGWLVARLRERRDELRSLLMEERELARTDAITGLPNSRAFYEQAEHMTGKTSPMALAYMDLDNFKNVNDRFGHAAGDEVLRKIAQVLRATIRPHDLAARLGGDEFAFLLTDVTTEEAAQVAERLSREVRSLAVEYERTDLGATIGIVWSAERMDVDALIHSADAAMYEGKQGRKGSIQFRQLPAAGTESPAGTN